jgi:hypothetical protein
MSKEKRSALYTIASYRNCIHKFEENEDFFLVDSLIVLFRNIQNDKLVGHLSCNKENCLFVRKKTNHLYVHLQKREKRVVALVHQLKNRLFHVEKKNLINRKKMNIIFLEKSKNNLCF